MKIAQLQIAESNVNHVGRRTEHHARSEVGVLGDDGQMLALGVCPNLAVAPRVAEVIDVEVIGT
jgi:hypothetical protein